MGLLGTAHGREGGKKVPSYNLSLLFYNFVCIMKKQALFWVYNEKKKHIKNVY